MGTEAERSCERSFSAPWLRLALCLGATPIWCNGYVQASTGEASSTMGDYMQKLEVFDQADKPTKDNPGTFFLDTASGQDEVRETLEACLCLSHVRLVFLHHDAITP